MNHSWVFATSKSPVPFCPSLILEEDFMHFQLGLLQVKSLPVLQLLRLCRLLYPRSSKSCSTVHRIYSKTIVYGFHYISFLLLYQNATFPLQLGRLRLHNCLKYSTYRREKCNLMLSTFWKFHQPFWNSVKTIFLQPREISSFGNLIRPSKNRLHWLVQEFKRIFTATGRQEQNTTHQVPIPSSPSVADILSTLSDPDAFSGTQLLSTLLLSLQQFFSTWNYWTYWSTIGSFRSTAWPFNSSSCESIYRFFFSSL